MNRPRTFVLTGCASGIGRHLATVLARRGERLLVTDVNLPALEALAAEQNWPASHVAWCRLDVRDPDDWRAALQLAVERFEQIDVLLNIAGIVQPGWIHESTPEQIALHLDINAKGVMLGTQAAARHMVQQRSGHIVNIASMAALAPVPGIALYSASKFAVRGFSLAVARELRPHNVAVTVLCPDAVQTPMLDLQIDYDEAALTFSGPRPLTVLEIERALLDRVLPHRPLEVILPRSRGWLAKLASAAPQLSGALLPWLTRKGLARQAVVKQSRTPQPPIAPATDSTR